jgi:hypothetical protein
MKRLGLAFKFGFKFPVGGSVPVIFSSLPPPQAVLHHGKITHKFYRRCD